MIALVQYLLEFFNVTLVQNELTTYQFDYSNNIVTIRNDQKITTGKSLIDTQVYTEKLKDQPILSVKED
jgi:hypothetical protein